MVMKIVWACKPFSLRRSLSVPGLLTLPGLKLHSRLWGCGCEMSGEFGSLRTLDPISIHLGDMIYDFV